jgi:hypothetical protein
VAALAGVLVLAGGCGSPSGDATQAITRAPSGSALSALGQLAIRGPPGKTSTTTAATPATTSFAVI